MIEFLFLVGFAFALFFTGVSFVGMLAAMFVGFIIMALAGMIGLLFKLLPWILLIAVVVWFCRSKDTRASHYRSRCRRYSRHYAERR